MAMPTWQISGRYMETCSCDYLCPCPTSNFSAPPSRGSCTFAMVFAIERGRFGEVPLDGLNFVVLGRTPAAMDQGNWSVGAIVDERANPDQQQALGAILSGQAGGPLAPVMPLIGTENHHLGTDGLIKYRSSHIDGAESEFIVPGNHLATDTREVAGEIRRILLEHLAVIESDNCPSRKR